MKTYLNKLINHQSLTREEAKAALVKIGQGFDNQYQITAFISAFLMRPIKVEELQGFRDALLELCVPINMSDFKTIDVCGTGGDGKNTFNVSTLSSIVSAAVGLKVVKHGNYSVSSQCGSSDVLEYMGVKFTNDESKLKQQLDKTGICFLHAPLFHPALKNVGPVRKALGIKTFFNMLGPMVNPAVPQHQLVGVFSLELLRLYNYLYQDSGVKHTIIHALDGYDEISLTGATKFAGIHGEGLISPSDFGVETQSAESIYGGETVKEAADIFTNVLEGRGTEQQNNVVSANAALAITTYYNEIELADAFVLAKEAIEGKKALEVFKNVLNHQ
jgi:anthranilate phosphoribosyltransferase